jgi:type VI secretion system protein VasD
MISRQWVLIASVKRVSQCCALTVISSFLLACSSAPQASSGLFDSALEMVGLQKLEPPTSMAEIGQLKANVPLKLPLRIHAGEKLNAGTSDRPLSLIIKLYKLKGYDGFSRTPYQSFSDGAFKSDEVVDVKEIVLLPGQRYEVTETMPSGVSHFAVVGLFRSPEELRWKFIFDLEKTGKEGITLGAHACALNVTQGATVGSPPETRRLAGAHCR